MGGITCWRNCFAIALHMHQPLILAETGDLSLARSVFLCWGVQEMTSQVHGQPLQQSP
jgi:hypothetical protein